MLTNVALDHMDVLGDTREAIAAEKLAVVQPGSTVVLGDPEWEQLARENGAAARRRRRQQQPRARGRGGRGVPRRATSTRTPRRTSSLPGRLERRGEQPLEIWDGAHNLAGVGYLLPRLPEREYVALSARSSPTSGRS